MKLVELINCWCVLFYLLISVLVFIDSTTAISSSIDITSTTCFPCPSDSPLVEINSSADNDKRQYINTDEIEEDNPLLDKIQALPGEYNIGDTANNENHLHSNEEKIEIAEWITEEIQDYEETSVNQDVIIPEITTNANNAKRLTSTTQSMATRSSVIMATYSTLSNSKLLPTPNSSANTVLDNQYTNTSDPLVQFHLICTTERLFCNTISHAVKAAIDEFTRVIYVKNSLLIKVSYYSFCDKLCANNTFGWGAPTSHFTLPFEDGADLNHVYPQALAKQLAPYSSTSVWSKYDIEIDINHDIYMNTSDPERAILSGWDGKSIPPDGTFWFYKNATHNDILAHQIDFRYIVLHELLHGLGFLSSWAAYFWTDASPFRTLVEGVIDPLELQLVTPGPYWFVNQETGPTYITGFQPTMIFDKYLVSRDTELNSTRVLSDVAFEMQNFCVQHDSAFIINFIKAFNAANQSSTAHKLWMSMSEEDTLLFQFTSPMIANSSYNHIPYLNQTYQNMTLLTGEGLLSQSKFEHTDSTLNRPGLSISHLHDQYSESVDFIMTRHYHFGQTLEDLTKQFYDDIPVLKYNVTLSNYSMAERVYRSPIGPGVLRILDSLGYSTVLTRTNYTTDGNVKTPKSRSVCEDSNTNHALKTSPTSPSLSSKIYPNLFITLIIIIITHTKNLNL
ncbi:hypothetical protein BDB01DRAFT_769681 [Pilobolus umbonatus]|nr:hypothetical protein BDB01DRAFT_769681 [Pilobolus umbonatus]